MSDSSDGEKSKGWTLVDKDGHAQDSDSGASSCDVALDDNVVHFHHKPHRSSSVVSCNSGTSPPEGGITPTNPSAASSLPANFRAQHQDSMVSSGHSQPINPNCITTTISTTNLQPPSANHWPQGARPKTLNHPITPPPATMEQSSSSNSTIVEEEERSVKALYSGSSPHGQRSPHHESIQDVQLEESDESDEEADTFAPELSEEKADTSSMSSIEILNTPSEEWPGSLDIATPAPQDDIASDQVIQPLVSMNALNNSQGHPNSEPVEMHTSDHRSTSGSDSDFVRISPSMVQEAQPHDQDAPSISKKDDREEYGEGASALPEADEEEDPRWNHSFQSASRLSASSFSLPGDGPPVYMRHRPPHSMDDISHGCIDDISHGRYHRLHRHPAMDEEGDLDDIPGPSRRFGGEERLWRRYPSRRLHRDMSGSVSSSASDLSSFSFLGLRRNASHRSIQRQHSDDMSEISSVFTDNTDDLPANMMIGTTKPGPKQYKHRRAERLNSTLNYVVLLVITSVFALGIGHYVGSYQEKHYMHQIRTGQVKRLRELQDDLITCLDKRTTEIDDKQTFSDMVISLLGDDVQQDEIDESNEVTPIDCSSCGDTENRYSESCDSLCVEGGFWAELDEAIADMPTLGIGDVEGKDRGIEVTVSNSGGVWADLDLAITNDGIVSESSKDKSDGFPTTTTSIKPKAESAKEHDMLQNADVTISDKGGVWADIDKVDTNADLTISDKGGVWADIDKVDTNADLTISDKGGVWADIDKVDTNADLENDWEYTEMKSTEPRDIMMPRPSDFMTTDWTDYPATDPLTTSHIPTTPPTFHEMESTHDIISDSSKDGAESDAFPTTTITTLEPVVISDAGGDWAEVDDALTPDKSEPERVREHVELEFDVDLMDIEAGIEDQFMPDMAYTPITTTVEGPITVQAIYTGVQLDGEETQPISSNVKIDTMEIDPEIDVDDEVSILDVDEDIGDPVSKLDCRFCNQAPMRYSKTCNILCVQGEEGGVGGDWADIDEALSSTPDKGNSDINSEESNGIWEDYAGVHTSEGKIYNQEEITKMEHNLNRKQDKLEDEETGLERVIFMPPQRDEEEIDNLDAKDEDDDWIQIEDDDDDDEDDVEINDKDHQYETIQPDDELQDKIFNDDPDEIFDTYMEDPEPVEWFYKMRLEELEEQLKMAHNRADMWQGKYVGDHHHPRSHPEERHQHRAFPEATTIESMHEDSEMELYERILELEDQLVLAKARGDMWHELYLGKSDDGMDKQDKVSDENTKEELEVERPKASSDSDSKDSKENQHRCGPLGCFNVFENILTDFLNSSEGKQFLRFANITEVLNNATFWEEFAMAANISAYTISDSVYKNWLEFQDYIKSAQNSDFIASFGAVLARAGGSVASAFGSVKNYSSTFFKEQNITLSGMGEKAHTAWDSVRNFTSDSVEQNINMSNINQAAQDVFEKVKNISSQTKGTVQDVWSTMKNFSDDAFKGQNISLTNLKEKVAAAWSSVRNMSAKVVSNDTKMKLSDIAGQVTDNVKDIGQTVHDAVKSMKDVVGDWRKGKRQKKRDKREKQKHFDKTDEDEDPSQEKRSRRHTRTDTDTQHPRNKQAKCKGKKCNKKQDDDVPQDQFGPDNFEAKRGKRGKHQKNHHEKHNKHKHDRKQDKHGRKHEKTLPRYRDIDWEDELDVFNMNCFGNADCMSHQRRDAARLYEEITEYKAWLKAHHRKKELKKVRVFLEALADFLNDPVLDDEDLEELKEEFEDVLEHVGRFVQDQYERSEENNTVIVDLKLLKKDTSDDKASESVPNRRKFAGFGYQSDGDDDNWFLRRGKDREHQHEDDDDEHDGGWYHHWMQGRSDSRTGVTVWDMYQWITDRFTYREEMRQQEDINWFLKRP